MANKEDYHINKLRLGKDGDEFTETAYNADFSIGTKAGTTINVAITLKGSNVQSKKVQGFQAYLSDNADGSNVLAVVTSGAVAIGTNGVLEVLVAKKVFLGLSDANGLIDINITEAGAKTLYLCLILKSGLKVSKAITF